MCLQHARTSNMHQALCLNVFVPSLPILMRSFLQYVGSTCSDEFVFSFKVRRLKHKMIQVFCLIVESQIRAAYS